MSAELKNDDDMDTSEAEEQLIIKDTNTVFSLIPPGFPNPPLPQSGPLFNPLLNFNNSSRSTLNSSNIGLSQPLPPIQFLNPYNQNYSLFSPKNNNLPHYDENLILNNDEPIEIKPSTDSPLLTENLVTISLKSLVNKLKLSSLPKEVPCVISLQGGNADIELIEKNRQGLDLIFVVDVSGSMDSGKLNLVKLTMEFVVTLLKEYDRMSIIVFSNEAHIVCPLIVMSQVGKTKINGLIEGLAVISGTNMEVGVCAALHSLADRKYINQLTSVLMLSDGIDDQTTTINERINNLMSKYKQKITNDFRIHTFGYGKDHDSRVMNTIAEQNNGNFYFIENETSIGEAFGNCLGELVSLAGDNVQVSLKTKACGIPFSLCKVFSSNGDVVFPMPQIFFNDKKDSVFVLKFEKPLEAVNVKSICPLEARVSYTLKSGEVKSLTENLVIEIAKENEEVQESDYVVIEYFRVKIAEVLKEIVQLADQNKLQEAQTKAKNAQNELKNSSVFGNSVIQALFNDLEDAQRRVFSRQSWEAGGRAQVTSLQHSHFMQKPSSNCVSYQNSVQSNYSLNANIYLTSSIANPQPNFYNTLPISNNPNRNLPPANFPSSNFNNTKPGKLFFPPMNNPNFQSLNNPILLPQPILCNQPSPNFFNQPIPYNQPIPHNQPIPNFLPQSKPYNQPLPFNQFIPQNQPIPHNQPIPNFLPQSKPYNQPLPFNQPNPNNQYIPSPSVLNNQNLFGQVPNSINIMKSNSFKSSSILSTNLPSGSLNNPIGSLGNNQPNPKPFISGPSQLSGVSNQNSIINQPLNSLNSPVSSIETSLYNKLPSGSLNPSVPNEIPNFNQNLPNYQPDPPLLPYSNPSSNFRIPPNKTELP